MSTAPCGRPAPHGSETESLSRRRSPDSGCFSGTGTATHRAAALRGGAGSPSAARAGRRAGLPREGGVLSPSRPKPPGPAPAAGAAPRPGKPSPTPPVRRQDSPTWVPPRHPGQHPECKMLIKYLFKTVGKRWGTAHGAGRLPSRTSMWCHVRRLPLITVLFRRCPKDSSEKLTFSDRPPKSRRASSLPACTATGVSCGLPSRTSPTA